MKRDAFWNMEQQGNMSKGNLKLKALESGFSVCKVEDFSMVSQEAVYYFTGKTKEENSLVCKTADIPPNTLDREDGWKGFFIEGTLDFSLIGILAEISAVLADNGISIFVVSTYNTDYIFVKQENFQKALQVLEDAGFER